MLDGIDGSGEAVEGLDWIAGVPQDGGVGFNSCSGPRGGLGPGPPPRTVEAAEGCVGGESGQPEAMGWLQGECDRAGRVRGLRRSGGGDSGEFSGGPGSRSGMRRRVSLGLSRRRSRLPPEFVTRTGSSEEFVGKWRLGQLAKRMI